MDQITQQNAPASEDLASASEEMNSQAQQLQEMMSFFKLDIVSGSGGSGRSSGAPRVARTSKQPQASGSSEDKGDFDDSGFERF